MILGFSQQTFDKHPNIEFNLNPSHWEPRCCTRTDIRTDRHDGGNGSFRQFCETRHINARERR